MKKIIHTNNAPAAIGAYSQAVRAGDTLYISGQIPLNPQTAQLVSESFRPQAEQVFRNLQAIIEEAGASWQNVVKINAYLTDLNHFATFNEVMASFIKQPYPARAAVEVSALPKNALVEAEAIVYFG